MGAFDELQRKLDLIAGEARRILKAKQLDGIKGIPGEAEWMGYNIDNKPTVKKNGEILVVRATSSINLPIGSKVYIDETLTIQHKTKKTQKKKKQDEGKTAGYDRRPFKKRKKIPIGPRIIKKVKGATWLVYHEYYKELSLTTDAQTATNPELFGWSLFMSLAPLAILGGGLLLGVIYWTLFEFKIEPVTPLPILENPNLPNPSNHPDINTNDNLKAENYTYFFLLQGVVDQLFTSTGLLAYPPVIGDGFWLGINQAIGNNIFLIGGTNAASVENLGVSNGLTFSDKYFLRPWAFQPADQLVGLLTHFGPGKVQACLFRVVGVYPSKKFKVNFHAWKVPDINIPTLNPASENYYNTLNELLPMKHKQFVIPDDITEWNQMIGDGILNPNNDVADVIPYEIIPAHDFQSYGDPDAAYDLTKFASYSQNNLYVNYVIKAYAPWTGLGDTLRINYYSLVLRATNSSDDDGIQVSYTLRPSTFDVPFEMKFDNAIYLEDPKFPLQGGERNVAKRQITYKIKGTDDPSGEIANVIISASRGDVEKRGFLLGSDPDTVPPVFDAEANKYKYVPGSNLIFNVNGAPEGFEFDPNTGEYVFDQNISPYGIYGTGQGVNFEFSYTVEDPTGETSTGEIFIYLVGSQSTFISNGSALIGSEPSSVSSDAAAPPDNPWDPDPVYENEEKGETQIFEKITTEIPFPDESDDGEVWGWAGRRAQVKIKPIAEPIIKLKIGDVYYDNPGGYSADDFIFSVTTDAGRIGTATKFITDFTVKPKNYDKLASNQELSITYTIEGLLNNAPFVGNFEDMVENQKKKIRSDFIAFAYPNDWRGNIYNLREAQEGNNIFVSPLGESPTRDTPRIPELNIDIPNRDITANWIKEFTWYSEEEGKTDPKFALRFNEQDGTTTTYEDEYLKILNLTYKFDQTSKELLFYSVDDPQQITPLDEESIQEAIDTASQIQIKKRWLWDALPFGMDVDDETGAKWRLDREYTQPLKGYMIFGWSE
ncbi:MAG: hypothetical protein ACO24P_00680 [Candidatus Nanopelagicaceae bacterium]